MKGINHLYGSFELKNTSENEDFFYFEGYGSTFGNTDLVDDVIEKGAFANSIVNRKPKLLWSHDPKDLPIGTIDEILEDEKGLFIKCRLPKKVTKANDIGELLKMKALDSMSIGFKVRDYEIKDKIRYIKGADLYEISIVVFPANPEATITDVKSSPLFKNYPLAEKDTPWDKEAARKRVEEFIKSVEKSTDIYRECHMWHDSDSPEDTTAFKFLFCDVVGGELKAIPKAIFSVEMAENINNKRDFEKLLRDVGFSRKAALLLTSRFKEDVQRDSSDIKIEDLDAKAQVAELSELIDLFKLL